VLKKVNTHLIPFFDYYAPKKNLRHVEVDVDMRGWVKQYMIDTDKDALTLAKVLPYNGFNSYNYSYRKNRISTVSVNTGGVLKVNDIGNSAFNNPSNLDKENYEAQLGGECGGATVTINGGSFWLGSPTDTKKSATVSVSETNAIIMNSGAITLHNGSKLLIRSGGKVFFNGGRATLLNGSQIIIEKGGQLTIKGNSNAHLYVGTQILVQDGGELIIQENAVTNLYINGQVNIQKGGKLNIASATTRATFNGDGSLTRVLIEGELQSNAPIKMNGTAYFDFAPNHKVTLLSTFDVLGNGQAVKMINLQSGATLNLQGKNTILENGAVIYNDNSKLQMPQGKSADFVNINFNGVGTINMTGISNLWNVSPAIVRVTNCVFNDLNKCMELPHNATSQSPTVLSITGSTFSNYKDYGIFITKASQLFATNSSFFSDQKPTIVYNKLENIGMLSPESTAPPAIIADEVKGPLSLTGCEISGVGADVFKDKFVKEMQSNPYNTNAYQLLPLFDGSIGSDAAGLIEGFSMAVYLNDVPHFYMKEGTNIHHAYNAIYARGHSNIIMSKGASLLQNGIAVNMEAEDSKVVKTPKGGLFFMDCSDLSNNALGVLGRDVTLFTDEFVNSNYNNPNTFSNFIEGKAKGRFFDIYYSIDPATKQSSHVYNNYTIVSRNNIWLPDIPVQTEDYCIVDYFNINGSSKKQYTLDVDPPAQPKSGDCYTLSDDDDPFTPDPIKQGGFYTSAGTVSALPFAWSGISAMLNQNLDKMREAFSPLAAVSSEERNSTESVYTQMYVDIAKAFVYAESEIDLPYAGGRSANNKPAAGSGILVYPNPAHQWLTVDLPNQTHKLQLVDGLGRSVYSESVSGTTRLNVGQYPSGVYHVIVTDAKGVQTRSKVIVQHD
jgi:hypothetical protein